MRSCVLFLLALLLLPGLLLAQGTTGKIKGVVTDRESKEPLIGATVGIPGAFAQPIAFVIALALVVAAAIA